MSGLCVALLLSVQDYYRKDKDRGFTAADDDFVYSYKVVVDGNEEKFFFGDYYNGIGIMSKTVELTLKSDGQQHNYKICASTPGARRANTE